MSTPTLSVVVPTLDEADTIDRILDDVGALSEALSLEVVVADGGSGDGTRERARRLGARVVVSRPGRGVQLAQGVSAARAPWLFIVHADASVPAAARAEIVRHVRIADARAFAHFRFELDGPGARLRWIEWGQRLRERLLGLVYGDQGLLVHRDLYERAGGFPAWRLFEDVEIVDRLERAGGRRCRLAATLPTSSRRYEHEGAVTAVARNLRIAASFRFGGDPERLAAAYPARRRAPTRAVVVLAKEPIPGRVKTRLAAEVGESEATRIYSVLARSTVDALRGGGWDLFVYAEPPDLATRRRVAAWLGLPLENVRGQVGGDLGTRMSAALDDVLEIADRACLVGTDLPDMDIETVDRAFAALDDAPVVLGPATDGGYYLVGVGEPSPHLFQGIEWSTGSVLQASIDRAKRVGAPPALLDERTDVDTSADVPEAFWKRPGARTLQKDLRGP